MNATYDVAGNVTSLAGASYTWDALGMMRSSTVYPATTEYIYTPDEERIGKRYSDGLIGWTVRDFQGKVLREFSGDAWVEDRIYRDGELLAAERTGSTLHFHLDHLGTPRLITDAAGAVVAYHDYTPFGTEINQAAVMETPEERLKFAAQERDLPGDSHATDYVHARSLSPRMGRFLSVDPNVDVEKAAYEPQMWNRYAYVGNNPLKYSDPNGKERLGYWNLNRDPVPDRGFTTEMISTAKTAAWFGGVLAGPSLAAEGAFEGSLMLMRNPGGVLAAMKVLDAFGGDGSTHVNPTGLTGNKLGYLLGQFESVESRGKGGFFAGVMGFTTKTLDAALRSQFSENLAKNGVLQADGRLVVTGTMTGTNGVVATVKTVWQWIEKTKTWDLITAIPPK